MARMKTGRLTPQTTDPRGNRVADPEKFGRESQKGMTYSSWPEMQKQYKQGKNEDVKMLFNMKSTPKEVKDYIQGKVNTLSEKYDEPVVNSIGGIQYSHKAEFNEKPPVKKPVPPTNTSDTIDKMPIRKPTSIATNKAGITGKEKPEPAAFVNPNKKAGSNAPSMNAFAGGAKTKGSGKRYVKQVINSIGGPNNRGYNKEEKLFKAKAGTSASGIDFSNMTSGEIKQKRQDLKSDRRDYRKGTNSDAKTMAIKEAGMDIRQSRKAQTYTKKMEGGGKPFDFFTPSYKKEETPRAVSRIIEYKNSQDNVNNRNTIDAKLKAIGEKSKPGSFGVMPTS